MPAGAVFPSGTNTYMPNHEASGKLIVDFSRNPKDFKLSKWTQYVPTEKNVGRYIRMTVEMAGRILSSNGSDLAWGDGTQRPSNQGNTESFEYFPFLTRRFETGANLGELSVEQADWDILAQHSRIHAQRMMTLRTVLAVGQATKATNYASNHQVAAVTAIDGVQGPLDHSTTARMDIKRTFDFMADRIRLDTLGAVRPDQMMVVVSPTWARKVALCQEIRDYVKGSPDAKALVSGNFGPHNNYGLPEVLYDYPLVVEDAVKITTRKGQTASPTYVWPAADIVMCSRIGGLEGIEGAPSFSSFQIFFKEEMTVESKHDRDNRRHSLSVVDDQVCEVVAPISAFLAQGTLAA